MARCSATTDSLLRCRRREGHEGEHVAGPRGTTLRNVRIDDNRWDALGQAAESDGTDRSKLIRDMIDVFLEDRDE